MALRNRWIVRTINPYDFAAARRRDAGCTHCVECRATNAIAFYGTLAQCKVYRRMLNAA
jgi:hypothetical protein